MADLGAGAFEVAHTIGQSRKRNDRFREGTSGGTLAALLAANLASRFLSPLSAMGLLLCCLLVLLVEEERIHRTVERHKED